MSWPRTPVPLGRIVARLERERLLVEAPAAETEIAVAGITDDSRAVARGALFCAWAGTAVDAHEFVAAAAGAGAAAAIVERRVDGAGIPQVVVRDGRRAAALAAAEVYGNPAAELRLVGVTGTNGKTTTVWILRHLLAATRRSASIGTLGVFGPDGRIEAESLTTPGPVQLAATLRELREQGASVAAMEVSSHALDQGRVDALRFEAAVFTNLTRDHLDYHGTEAAYLTAKLRLAELLAPGGVAVINADEPAWSAVRRRASHTLCFSATGTPHAVIRAESIELGAFGARFDLAVPDGTYPVELPLLGEYNVANGLAAAAACIALGDDGAAVASALRAVPQVPGRLERIAERPCPVLRDYAHTPDALERALGALRPLVEGRLIVVFGAGGDRDRGKRPLMGEVAERGADVAIVTSDNPRTEDPDVIVDEIIGGMKAATAERITNRRDAIARALDVATPDDLVLLAGKGHETYQIVGTEKRDFDERRVVEDLLHETRDAGAA